MPHNNNLCTERPVWIRFSPIPLYYELIVYLTMRKIEYPRLSEGVPLLAFSFELAAVPELLSSQLEKLDG